MQPNRKTHRKTMRIVVLAAILLGASISAGAQSPEERFFAELERAWARGDVGSISSHFADRVHLEIPGFRDTVGRRQATNALRDFLNNIQIVEFKKERSTDVFANYRHRYRANGRENSRRVYIHVVKVRGQFQIDDITEHGR